jgi:hypothetical protein
LGREGARAPQGTFFHFALLALSQQRTRTRLFDLIARLPRDMRHDREREIALVGSRQLLSQRKGELGVSCEVASQLIAVEPEARLRVRYVFRRVPLA